MFKNMRLVILFDMFLNLSLKVTASFGNLSNHIKNTLWKLCKEFCKEKCYIELVFTSFKIKNYFSYKDPIPGDLKSFLAYKFTWASCSSSYIG